MSRAYRFARVAVFTDRVVLDGVIHLSTGIHNAKIARPHAG